MDDLLGAVRLIGLPATVERDQGERDAVDRPVESEGAVAPELACVAEGEHAEVEVGPAADHGGRRDRGTAPERELVRAARRSSACSWPSGPRGLRAGPAAGDEHEQRRHHHHRHSPASLRPLHPHRSGPRCVAAPRAREPSSASSHSLPARPRPSPAAAGCTGSSGRHRAASRPRCHRDERNLHAFLRTSLPPVLDRREVSSSASPCGWACERPGDGTKARALQSRSSRTSRFGTLADVVDHYDSFFALRLTPTEKTDLVEYLKSAPSEEESGGD
jgi:hypothetical protein